MSRLGSSQGRRQIKLWSEKKRVHTVQVRVLYAGADGECHCTSCATVTAVSGHCVYEFNHNSSLLSPCFEDFGQIFSIPVTPSRSMVRTIRHILVLHTESFRVWPNRWEFDWIAVVLWSTFVGASLSHVEFLWMTGSLLPMRLENQRCCTYRAVLKYTSWKGTGEKVGDFFFVGTI